jgi:hypothetical protein
MRAKAFTLMLRVPQHDSAQDVLAKE